MFKKQKSYQIKERKPEPVGLFQKIYSSVQKLIQNRTNTKYNWQKAISEVTEKLFEPQEEYLQKYIIIQGKRYRTRKQAKTIVKNILWFSYRKGFNIKNQYKSDVGWGCLVRVGQMALASALFKHFQSQKQKLGMGSFQSDKQNIITAFSDVQGVQQKYSLNVILEIAGHQYQHKPGQWFDLSKISHCLKFIQNKRPMKGSAGLKIMVCDQMIDVKTIFKIENLPSCKCGFKCIVCDRCHEFYKPSITSVILKNRKGNYDTFQNLSESQVSLQNSRIEQANFTKKNNSSTKGKGIKVLSQQTSNKMNSIQLFRNQLFTRDLYLFVVTRVSDKQNNQQINNAIFSLLDLEICMGIMTGFPGKAIFLVGRQNDRLIYLNPHYVQDNYTFAFSDKNTYVCQQYLTCQRNQLDPCMAFCFYIQNLNQLQILAQTINYVQYKYPNVLSIGVDYRNQYFDFNEYAEQEDDKISVMSCQSAFKM